MKIVDSIYGEFKIEPIIQDLINTKEVQRLKKIHQGGANYLTNSTWNVTRYEHSIGTMLLVKILGGSVEEQIAALLHDVSHTAFSHLVDLVLENEDEDYHEKIYKKMINESQIPEILIKYNYNPNEILFDEKRWTILEKSSPDLCADRIDYTLRDMFQYKGITKIEINKFIESLIIYNGEIVLNNIEIAEWFTETYYKEVIDFFMNPLNVYSNQILSKAIQKALSSGEINKNDLETDDEILLNKLKKTQNKEILELISKIHEGIHVEYNELNYDIHQTQKIRLIDPMVLIDGKAVRASSISKKIQKKIK
ncbi:HD domain-containing protein [Romboutsia lituseburensis]|uniref:HD domain-containing protein n=1 Tax=Romboutsia lituseburensis TaxID=1537 RepID=UPI00215B427B|nr:HD domain-containing protein [Romboutsia lituseburensis]MCR8746338.1 HD domain-containing protein [Romboutsia lituseburensis]